MAKILIIYSTTDGHTRKICQHLKIVIEQHGHQASIFSIDDVQMADMTLFDKIVIGASIRYGRHSKQVYEFVKNNQPLLDSKPNAFFSVNVVARKAGKDQPDTNPYLRKFLKQISWKPKQLAVFAGKIDYQKYRLADRLMIRLIMWITNGPTDPKTNVEFTDWKKVDAFGLLISNI